MSAVTLIERLTELERQPKWTMPEFDEVAEALPILLRVARTVQAFVNSGVDWDHDTAALFDVVEILEGPSR